MVNMAIPRVEDTTSSEPQTAILETTRNSDGDIQDNNINVSSGSDSEDEDYTPRLTMADFPKPTRQHIMNCSYSAWHAKYRSITPKSRIIPLSPEFIAYLREDGIVLPEDESTHASFPSWASADDEADDWDTATLPDPIERIRPIHDIIRSTIKELGGKVHPKLNWSAPKDAGFLTNNTLQSFNPNDIYLLLKSSDFVTHDLEHAFDDTLDDDALPQSGIQYDLILRKWVDVITSVEFRCFVKNRKLVAVSQRDMNYYDFLFDQKDDLLEMIEDFYTEHLLETFPDDNFTFDVYIPKSRLRASRVWLIDINPWAPRTDPLMYSWTEILNIDTRDEDLEPLFRLVKKDDPEAYNFNQSQYSAYKLPKEVFDAGSAGVGSLGEFAQQWKDITAKLEKGEKIEGQESSTEEEDSSEEEEEMEEEGKEKDVKGKAKENVKTGDQVKDLTDRLENATF